MFHRVDPRLRVLKDCFPDFGGLSGLSVSSRRPEVEGTESAVVTEDNGGGLAFHRVDPRLRVLKVVFVNCNPLHFISFHRVDPRLRVLKGRLLRRITASRFVSSRRPEVEGTERQFP